MNHPECAHPVSNVSDDYLGVECCVCAGAPCDAVTVALMTAHRAFDIDLYTGGARLHVAPF